MSISSISSTSSYAFLDKLVMNSRNSSKTQGTEDNTSAFATQIIKKEDKDGDGMISATESALDSDRFNEIDTDSDGLITSEELQSSVKTSQNDMLSQGMSGVQGMQGPPPPPPDASQIASNVMDSADTDGDGVLSVSESGLSDDEFSILDTDGDGSVTADELQSGIQSRMDEMDKERETMASEANHSANSTTSDSSSLDTLLKSLTTNDATSAYSDQSLYSLLQASAQNLSLSA